MTSNQLIDTSSTLEPGQPAWRIALFFPEQGGWSETDYFELDGGPLVDFDNGFVEVHDMPTMAHQRIVRHLFQLLSAAVDQDGLNEAFFAPLPIRLWSGKFREPDLIVVSKDRPKYKDYPEGADLVMEVVSADKPSRVRDLETKLKEYAQAKIEEYWIIDPQQQRILRCCLHNDQYDVSVYTLGQSLTSKRMPHFEVNVANVLDAANV